MATVHANSDKPMYWADHTTRVVAVAARSANVNVSGLHNQPLNEGS
jgi:hypothetical protein